MKKFLLISSVLLSLGHIPTAAAKPFHHEIPTEFHGVYAIDPAECGTDDGDVIRITSDAFHFYEGDHYLLIGVSYRDRVPSSTGSIPLFSGRYVSRFLASLPGDIPFTLGMETPNKLIKFLEVDADGNEIPFKPTVYHRCKGHS